MGHAWALEYCDSGSQGVSVSHASAFFVVVVLAGACKTTSGGPALSSEPTTTSVTTDTATTDTATTETATTETATTVSETALEWGAQWEAERRMAYAGCTQVSDTGSTVRTTVFDERGWAGSHPGRASRSAQRGGRHDL